MNRLASRRVLLVGLVLLLAQGALPYLALADHDLPR